MFTGFPDTTLSFFVTSFISLFVIIDPTGNIFPFLALSSGVGPGKAKALAGALGSGTLEAAFGDNAFDSDMLSAARRPIAVRPKQRLVERAEQIPTLRQLAP